MVPSFKFVKIRTKTAVSSGFYSIIIKIELFQFWDEDRRQAGVKLGQAQPPSSVEVKLTGVQE